MSDFVQFLALWAVTAGASIAIGASVRLAVDAWEARERARRAAAEPFTIHGFHKARFASRHMATFAMDTAWTEPERAPARDPIMRVLDEQYREALAAFDHWDREAKRERDELRAALGHSQDDSPALGGDRADR